ncbi:MAG: type II secretion system F family protein [Roseburia sp.]|nr:type II secretion system F family protein [Roseburia sp.]
MIVCGIGLGLFILVWMRKRNQLPAQKRKMLLILLTAAFLGLVLGVYEQQNPILLEGNALARNESGEGDYEQELKLTAEGLLEDYSYSLEVPEQSYTKEEADVLLSGAAEEIHKEFPGDNASVNAIRGAVHIREVYQDGRVTAEWNFDNYKIMDFEGNVIAEELPEEGELVKAEVELTCGEYVRVEEFYFRVLPELLDEEGTFLRQLAGSLKEQGEKTGTEYLELPGEVGGYKVSWSVPGEHMPEKVFFFGVLLAGMVPLMERSRAEERKKKRCRQMELEYPELVSKLALLLGAGMTLQGAWRKIALSYQEKRKEDAFVPMPAYEEMLVTSHEMESGIGEERAYERFGERCGLPSYRRLGNLLSQNLRKGGPGITALLETEAEAAFEERKNLAKEYGEEAATKLLFPMILMLGIVLVILIVPAIMTFQ